MIRVKVNTRVRATEFRSFVNDTLATGMQRAAGRVRDRAKANITRAGLVDTNAMRNQIVAETVQVDGLTITARVEGRAPYTLYQHEGTANDGTGYIVPRTARALRFRSGGRVVYAARVKGVKGVPFLRDALEATTTADFR